MTEPAWNRSEFESQLREQAQRAEETKKMRIAAALVAGVGIVLLGMAYVR